MVKSVTVRAPCSTANLGPGFDVFGMALDALYDNVILTKKGNCLLYTSPSPRDRQKSRMPSSA